MAGGQGSARYQEWSPKTQVILSGHAMCLSRLCDASIWTFRELWSRPSRPLCAQLSNMDYNAGVEATPLHSHYSCVACLQLLLWGTPEELTPGSAVFDAFKAVASQLKGKLVFVTVDNSGAAHEPVTNFFGEPAYGKQQPFLYSLHATAARQAM